ncbi:MAG TPA: SEC-C metal-binding domain-containing protein [Acidiferrobacteraceae bacterium]|nr:SEC-C metal-binding domain-containing protein [Acidiferrobacteraceae bacterium]
MTDRIGRNQPCPCGSGKKYKQCCLQAPADAPPRKPYDGAVARALDWLLTRYRKPVDQALRAALTDGLNPDEVQAFETLGQEAWEMIHRNHVEWLLAEGEIVIHGQSRRVSEMIQAPAGPLMTAPQRAWLEQLFRNPLRLYYVTHVTPGTRLTLCDALEPESAPIEIQEHAASVETLTGTVLGARLMKADDHWEFSGALYPFSHQLGPTVVDRLRELEQRAGTDAPSRASHFIRQAWLKQFVAPPEIPALHDSATGERMRLITDHYEVRDWNALSEALAREPDVDGDARSGWRRLEQGTDGGVRPSVALNIDGAAQLSLFYRTQLHADSGRPWFDGLAGDAVTFLQRESVDPEALLRQSLSQAPKTAAPRPVAQTLPPEALADAIEQAIVRSYAGWADQPLPVLQHRSPRAAIGTAAGLERVKGLLRSYQIGERDQARRDGRREISFAFLWEALGLTPEDNSALR